MPQFKHDMPELENLPTRMHSLRLRQLLDLAKAFDVQIPPRAKTKEQVLPFMTQAEAEGVFRRDPVSLYHRLHAEISHDRKFDSDPEIAHRMREDFYDRLRSAEWKEFPEEGANKNLHFKLQQECKRLGLYSMGKSVAEMRKMIKEAEDAAGAESSDQPSAD